MSNITNLSQYQDTEFFNQLANLQGGQTDRPRPVRIRLDGKSGVWTQATYSEALKKLDHVPYKNGSKEFNATILMIKYFTKQKYKENQSLIRRTREFTWDEPIKLLEIDYSQKENNSKEIAEYPTYQAFKDSIASEYGKAVNEALRAKKEIPKQDDYLFDLWTSIYFYDFEQERICNLQVKGMSRKAVFDYVKSWKYGMTPDVVSYSQILTTFSSVEHTEPINFYSLNLRSDSVLSVPHQHKVREAVLALAAWMKSYKEQESVPDIVVPETKAYSDFTEIRLDEIPF